jgi:hypothetical protein
LHAEKRSPLKALALEMDGILEPAVDLPRIDGTASPAKSAWRNEMSRFQESMNEMADRFFEQQTKAMEACLSRKHEDKD